MVVRGQAFLVVLMAFLGTQLPSLMAADCPLDLSSSNFTLVASMCSNNNADRGKCCRYMNAFLAVSIARYANYTTGLGVTPDLSEICLSSISRSMELYGVPRNATVFCGLGTKILVNYDCQGRTTVTQMLQSPRFGEVSGNCRLPLSGGNECRKCLNSAITYLRNLIGEETNVTLSTCRDATYVALASPADNASALLLASCFFQVSELNIPSGSSSSSISPGASTSPDIAVSPSSNYVIQLPPSKSHRSFHLTVVPVIGIAVTATALMMLVILIVLIRRKSRELVDDEKKDGNPTKTFPSPRPVLKLHEGNSSGFRRFNFKEMKKATGDFNTMIGRGGFGTVYKAEFSDGFVGAVKRMDKVSKQAEDEFCREIELLARLHHRHLVALKGFCVKKNERFLIYEFMANGSLKDHLHSAEKPPLSWRTRMKIAIDVANALEYLHFYCDPPLCHRDIKSSNILLDDNFVAKLADFGLAHASRDGSISFEPVNTDIRGTPGYVDPEYIVTQELTEKSDVYSYGVVLLEIITGRRVVDEGRNIVETSQPLMLQESRHGDLVDPRIEDCIDGEQLETMITVVRWCTEKEGRLRPSIKQVLRLIYECCDPLHSGFEKAVEEDEGRGGRRSGGGGRKRRSGRGEDSSGFQSGDIIRGLPSSSSTTSRSHCSRSFLLETGSPTNQVSF
ncbi:PREDICTED: probable receptor-like protein kinase At1g49730 isoform X2 [Tarenaya hassleriana]|uniref:probable receptor-like protein kinase At1g49730 isoform X2 n=1 Tax=Tarenaya hassleriana TaxID=28532 RepID=UPI00053C4634|nr:PREDICTED: probable receptor-like protein kinase At1g49730 isoform X2 [Tarenaya hassleriana]